MPHRLAPPDAHAAQPFRKGCAHPPPILPSGVSNEGAHLAITRIVPLAAMMVQQREPALPAARDIHKEVGDARRKVKPPRLDARPLNRPEGCLAGPQVVLMRDQRRPAMLEEQGILRREPRQFPFDLPDQRLGTAEPPIAMAQKEHLFGPPLCGSRPLLLTAQLAQGAGSSEGVVVIIAVRGRAAPQAGAALRQTPAS